MNDFNDWSIPAYDSGLRGWGQPHRYNGRLCPLPHPPLIDMWYMGVVKKGSIRYEVLEGSLCGGGEMRVWLYNSLHTTLGLLPKGKWICTSESTMERVDGPGKFDIDDRSSFPHFDTFEGYLRPSAQDKSYREYVSAWEGDRRLFGVLAKARAPEGRIRSLWTVGRRIGHVRVIAGMGPVPDKLRSKNYREIEAEGFGDYLGGPILYAEDPWYPNLIKDDVIYDFKNERRSSNTLQLFGQLLIGNRRSPRTSPLDLRLYGDSCPSWIGVVDLEVDVDPLKYHNLRDFKNYQPPLANDGRPYYEVTSGKLSTEVGPNAIGLKVGNVACGRWYFKHVHTKDVNQLLTWHESVDDDPEFQEGPGKDAFPKFEQKNVRSYEGQVREFQGGSLLKVRPYEEQKMTREVHVNIANMCIGEDVPMDVSEIIADFLIAHEDSPYWMDCVLPGGWILHRSTRLGGGFRGTDEHDMRYKDIREDVFYCGYLPRTWAWRAFVESSQGAVGIPGGCYLGSADSACFKFKDGVIRAALTNKRAD